MKHATFKRVLREVKEVNNDFFNLRTVISPDTVGDDDTRFFFMMLPNDGAMAHQTLVGTFYIPEEYPESPPIVQLYTPTRRYNVDAYRTFLNHKTPQSTMCFDILRSQAAGGTWKSKYTLSSLFASLMSAIVSFYVAQQSGGARPEYVSMELLRAVKEEAKNTFNKHKHHLPEVPRIPLVEAAMVPAKSLFNPQRLEAGSPDKLTSEPIYLQTGTDEVHSFAVDLSGLHPGIIFSVILSNSNDLVGKKADTILVRNGVTATAACKLANRKTIWFYHGKPMNDGDMRLHVTIGKDQMTFAYYEDGHLYVHGDCPVSRLSVDHIGDVKGMPFFVHIYTKDKTVGTTQFKGPAEIEILNIDGKGYIHESIGEDERQDFGFELIDFSEAEELRKIEPELQDGLGERLAEISI
ncbi:hypothetical protein IQ07DRAFT_647285 [Pyrenochaeta sp. DS3sAY3a]|nr:hypothetical protein IQ07DRAFT_647285 [Pyrenochaeta sp. DS3sAY3a]